MGKKENQATTNNLVKGIPLIIKDKRAYSVYLDESEGKLIVKAPRKICSSSNESYAVNVGAYLIKEKTWLCENGCILRPNLKLMVEELAENYLLQQTS